MSAEASSSGISKKSKKTKKADEATEEAVGEPVNKNKRFRKDKRQLNLLLSEPADEQHGTRTMSTSTLGTASRWNERRVVLTYSWKIEPMVQPGAAHHAFL